MLILKNRPLTWQVRKYENGTLYVIKENAGTGYISRNQCLGAGNSPSVCKTVFTRSKQR